MAELIANSPTPGSATPIATQTGNAAGAITAGATSMVVSAAAPTALQGGQFRIVWDDNTGEIALVTAGQTGTTWTITRGMEGSTANSHRDGAHVYHSITAASLDSRYLYPLQTSPLGLTSNITIPTWQPSTAYVRGQIVIDPYGVIRWCGVAHTSGSSFSAGTQFSQNSPWWMPLATNGSWRGEITASHNGTYPIQNAPNDLHVSNSTGFLQRGVFEDGQYGDLGALAPFVPIDPGVVLPPACMPDVYPNQGHGIWRKTSRLAYPNVKPTALMSTSADFTHADHTVTNDTDAPTPAGAAMMPYATSGTYGGALYTKLLSSTVDMSNAIFRVPIRISSTSTAAGTRQYGVLGSSLSTGGAISVVPLDASGLWFGINPGDRLLLSSGGHTQVVTVSGYVSAGAGASVSQIPVSSFTPNFAYPAASTTIMSIARLTLTDSYFIVSSDNFVTTGAVYPFFGTTGNNGAVTAFRWSNIGAGPGHWHNWLSGLSAPNLAAINSIGFLLVGDPTNFLSAYKVDVIPNNGAAGSKGDGRAKCCLWFDDIYAMNWSTAYNTMLQYGFPGNSAAAGAINEGDASTLNVDQMRYMSEYGNWDFAAHYYFPADGGDDQLKDGGPAKEYYMMRTRHGLIGAGLSSGTDHFSWHDDDGPGNSNVWTARKYFRATRGYSNGVTANVIMSLPPVEPVYVSSYGISTNDTTGPSIGTTTGALTNSTVYTSIPVGGGTTQNLAKGEGFWLGTPFGSDYPTVSANTAAGATSIPVNSFTTTAAYSSGTQILNPGSTLKSLIDQAVAVAGLIQLTWESTAGRELTNVCLYLDSQRSNIDVVTLTQALAPWTVPAG